MTNITRWDPFGDMLSLRQAMDRLLADAFVRPGQLTGWEQAAGTGASALDIDMYESEDELVVEAGLPGLKPEDVDISVQDNVLTIKGETRQEREEPEGRWHRRERRYGSVFRQVQLPVSVKTEGADARFEDGVLQLRLPKAEEARQRRIPITSGEVGGQRRQIGERGERDSQTRGARERGGIRAQGERAEAGEGGTTESAGTPRRS